MNFVYQQNLPTSQGLPASLFSTAPANPNGLASAGSVTNAPQFAKTLVGELQLLQNLATETPEISPDQLSITDTLPNVAIEGLRPNDAGTDFVVPIVVQAPAADLSVGDNQAVEVPISIDTNDVISANHLTVSADGAEVAIDVAGEGPIEFSVSTELQGISGLGPIEVGQRLASNGAAVTESVPVATTANRKAVIPTTPIPAATSSATPATDTSIVAQVAALQQTVSVTDVEPGGVPTEIPENTSSQIVSLVAGQAKTPNPKGGVTDPRNADRTLPPSTAGGTESPQAERRVDALTEHWRGFMEGRIDPPEVSPSNGEVPVEAASRATNANLAAGNDTVLGLSSVVGSANFAGHAGTVRTDLQPTMAAQISEVVENRIQTVTDTRMTQIEVDLDPPELGPITVRLKHSPIRTTAEIVVAREIAFSALQSELTTLQDNLQSLGVDLETVNRNQTRTATHGESGSPEPGDREGNRGAAEESSFRDSDADREAVRRVRITGIRVLDILA